MKSEAAKFADNSFYFQCVSGGRERRGRERSGSFFTIATLLAIASALGIIFLLLFWCREMCVSLHGPRLP